MKRIARHVIAGSKSELIIHERCVERKLIDYANQRKNHNSNYDS